MFNVFTIDNPLNIFCKLNAYGNAKTKRYANGHTNTVVARAPIFKDKNLEKVNYFYDHYENFAWTVQKPDKKSQLNLQKLASIKKYYGVDNLTKLTSDDIKIASNALFPRRKNPNNNPSATSLRRAKNSIFDYTLNNKFSYFFTGTIDPKQFDSTDPKQLLSPVQNWLKNCVKRYGLSYILIAEHHKSGAIHFHGLLNCCDDNLDMVYSGTRTYKGIKKPITDYTAVRKGLNPADGQKVYNLKKWSFGFTTCIPLYGDPLNVAYYITKYITKDCKKIFGKFYWHSRDLKKPDVIISNIDYDAFPAKEFKDFFKYRFNRVKIEPLTPDKQVIADYGDIVYDPLAGVVYNSDTGELYFSDV